MRTLGWQPISPAEYRACHARYGGSVITHPDVLEFLHERLPLAARYVGRADAGAADGLPQAAVCCWGKYLAGDASALGRHVNAHYDLGSPEIILPMVPGMAATRLWLRTSHLSPVSRAGLRNVRPVRKERRHLALAKGLGADGFSRKTAKRRRLDVRHFLDQGGEVRDVHEHDTETLVEIYRTLHQARWQRWPGERVQLLDLLGSLRHLLYGHVLWLQGRAVAFDLLFRAESPHWTSIECINGGYDPAVEACSPGSVLLWLNLSRAWDEATASGRELRFSLGHMDNEYKQTWCRGVLLYRTLAW